MLRIILGVAAGFIAWSIMWVGSQQVLMSVWPEWYGAHQHAFEKATLNKEPFMADTTILIMNLVRLTIVSILSGFLAAVIAGESKRSTLILAILLLAFGAVVTALTWSLLPIWYHILLLLLLVPMTILGGKLKRAA